MPFSAEIQKYPKRKHKSNPNPNPNLDIKTRFKARAKFRENENTLMKEMVPRKEAVMERPRIKERLMQVG